jgi:hypothetical protein
MARRPAMTKRERELCQLLSQIAERGNARLIEIRKTDGGHIRARFDRGPLVFTSSTPSEWRATKTLKAQARRALR